MLQRLREREARLPPAEWAWQHAGAALAAAHGAQGGGAASGASRALLGEVAGRARLRAEEAGEAAQLAEAVAAELAVLCAALQQLRPPPPWEVMGAGADWCELRPCAILALGRSGDAHAEEQQAGQLPLSERRSELRAKLELWRRLFFALSSHLVPAGATG